MSNQRRTVKIALVGGGSQSWAHTIIRDIVFKKGMNKVFLEFALLDTDLPRAKAIQKLFDARFEEWKVDWATTYATKDSNKALKDADFVVITISTGRLPAMKHDIDISEKYGVYHTVGDTAGPGGWARGLRNIPVFEAYAEQIAELCPNAYVLNYTNPMGILTKVLADKLGNDKVIGLCHGLFENYELMQAMFGVKEEDIQIRFGGLNHFFWILDFKVNGEDGYKLLEERLQGRNLAELVKETHTDSMGWSSDKWLAGELFANYGYLPYFGDRHTCEFFNCYMTNRELMERFKLKRTSIEEREEYYVHAENMIKLWQDGKKDPKLGALTKKPSRETAADILKAITFNENFTDVVNMVNVGQIANLPYGSVVETMGHICGSGPSPISIGDLPDSIAAVTIPHAEAMIRTTEAGLAGDLDEALMALVADPICSHMTASDIKKMGLELLQANKQYLPQFFGDSR